MVPFNAAAHEFLIANGFTHERFEASWEDTGDAENGPELSGGPAYDQYTDHDSYVIVDEEGHTHFDLRNLEFEKMLNEAEAGIYPEG